MLKKVLLIMCMAAPVLADTGFNLPSLTVSESDGSPRRRPVQELEFGPGQLSLTGTKVTIEGGVPKVYRATSLITGGVLISSVNFYQSYSSAAFIGDQVSLWGQIIVPTPASETFGSNSFTLFASSDPSNYSALVDPTIILAPGQNFRSASMGVNGNSISATESLAGLISNAGAAQVFTNNSGVWTSGPTTILTGIAASSFTLAGGTALQCVKLDANKNFVTTACGGSGASSLEVFTPTVESSPTASIALFGNDFLGIVIGSTFSITLNPETTDFIHNQTTPQTATFKVSSGTASTQFNTDQLKFTALNCVAMHKDGNCLLSLPDVNSTYFGYNSNLINTGGVFNTSFGATAMPYPGGGNFNTCIGNSCMAGNVITTAENNNAMGYASCGNLRAGFYNNCMGGSSGNSLRDGNYNTNVGAYAGMLNVDNNGNTNIGFESGKAQAGGEFATNVGFQAGQGTTTVNANLTGDANTYIGKNTGQGVRSDTEVNNSFAVGTGALVYGSGQGSLGGRLGSGTETNVYMASASVETASLSVNRVAYLWPASQASGTKILSNDGSGNLSWATDATGVGGGGEFLVNLSTGVVGYNISSVTNNFTASSTSTVILANASGGAFTVTLPTAVGLTGKVYTVKRLNSGANTVTIATTAAQTIDGATTQILNVQYTSVDLISDGSNWNIL